MKLIITDSLNNAEIIAKAIGAKIDFSEIGYFESKEFIITFSFGHLFTLYETKKYKLLDEPKYKERFAIIEKLIARPDVDLVVNACSSNQDGDSIFNEIFNAVGLFKPVTRLFLSNLEADLAGLKVKSLENLTTSLNNKDNILGNCPVCGKIMIEKDQIYECSGTKNGCKFKLYKNDRFLGSMGQHLTGSLVKGLLKGDSVLVRGLKSKAGKVFNAKIKLVEKTSGYWGFEFDGFES